MSISAVYLRCYLGSLLLFRVGIDGLRFVLVNRFFMMMMDEYAVVVLNGDALSILLFWLFECISSQSFNGLQDILFWVQLSNFWPHIAYSRLVYPLCACS
ncbi:hypothetical protein NM74_08050 [Aeromonas hydrophila]|nr:hypothetical protein NM74_08050 [Aeromonas hydrophila]